MQKKTGPLTSVLLVALPIALATLTGCGATVSLQPVATFATATETLAGNGNRAYELVNESRVTREIYDVAASPSNAPKDDTFAPLVSPSDATTMASLQLRFDLLEDLGNYAGALKALCESDFESEIDEAAADLNGALTGLRESYKKASGKEAPLSDDASAMIATGVSLIGKEVVEAQRQKALRTIITRVDPAVQAATGLISRDLSTKSEFAQFAQENASNTYGSARTAYLAERKSMTFEERLRVLQSLRALKKAEQDAPKFFADVSTGVEQVGRAHAALAATASDDDLTFKDFVGTVGEIAKKAKDAKKFYKTLKEAESPASTDCAGGN